MACQFKALMLYHTCSLSGWNRFPIQTCKAIRLEKYSDLLASPPAVIARGQGLSYGDAALNDQGIVLFTERLNRLLMFDKAQGVLTAEAGITLAQILTVIVPAGWFLPVTPGTQWVSLGGCVATDVHGKNHHHNSSIGQHIIEIELITANNTKQICSAKINPDLFWATVGGMGLTGIISTVTLQLKRIANNKMFVRHFPADNFDQLFQSLGNNVDYDDEYTVAWIDCITTGAQFGRGIVMAAHHASSTEYPYNNTLTIKPGKQKSIPFTCPGWLLNAKTIGLFNQIYYSWQAKKTNGFIVELEDYFYPLDALKNWNRLYGKNGFIQYQCVFPAANSYIGVKTILEKLSTAHCPSFLGVLKRFGPGSKGLLSFPMPGYTLAVDIPIKNQNLFKLLDELDDIVIQYGGRIYLAKDARLNAERFRAMYPTYSQWLIQKQKYDPENYFTSSLARRLQLGY